MPTVDMHTPLVVVWGARVVGSVISWWLDGERAWLGVGWLAGWLIGRLVNWSVGWLVGWLVVCSLICWLVGWLVGWL